MMRLRKIWAEGSFSVLKREHCISKIRKRGISATTEECLLAVMALNLKRMVRAIFYKLKIQFIWAEEVFPRPSFLFCQQVQNYAQICLQTPAEWDQPAIETSWQAASKCFIFMYFLLLH